MMRLAAYLKRAEATLAAAGRDVGAAEWWLMHVLGVDRTGLLIRLSEEVDPETDARFSAGLERLVAGEPVQHVIGFAPFYGRSFEVSGDVLIPRPETEELIDAVLARVPSVEAGDIVDIGTGSGAIAITLALELGVSVHTVDISEAALDVAQRNARALGADVVFHHGDCLAPIASESIRVLVSNPPYIEVGTELDATVVEHEPHLALFGGADGLDFYRRLVADAPRVLRDDWLLIAFEIGYNQGEAVKTLLSERYPEAETGILKDINGKDRIVFAVRKGHEHANEVDDVS